MLTTLRVSTTIPRYESAQKNVRVVLPQRFEIHGNELNSSPIFPELKLCISLNWAVLVEVCLAIWLYRDRGD